MKRSIYLHIIVLFLCLTACESERTYSLKSTPRGVVNVILNSDSVMKATVMHSYYGVIQQTKDFDPSSYYIKDANVEVYVNDMFRGRMIAGPEGFYSLPDYTPKPYDKVAVSVETSQYDPLWSETTIPLKGYITEFESSATPSVSSGLPDCQMEVEMKFKDDPKEKNYYMLKVYVSHTFRDKNDPDHVEIREEPVALIFDDDEFLYHYDTSINQYFFYGYIGYGQPVLNTSYVIFSDELFKNGDRTLRFSADEVMGSFENELVENYSICRFSLYTLSWEGYLFFRSKIAQFNEDDTWGNLGFREPLPTYSNVEGGYGLVSARQIDIWEIEMPQIPVDDDYYPFFGYGW